MTTHTWFSTVTMQERCRARRLSGVRHMRAVHALFEYLDALPFEAPTAEEGAVPVPPGQRHGQQGAAAVCVGASRRGRSRHARLSPTAIRGDSLSEAGSFSV